MQQEFEKLERVSVEALDEILGVPFKVLDDGFIRVVDYMGSDQSIVQAARVSYGKGTKQVRQDRGLIRYLMRHKHTTPFEMCEIKFHIRVPMDAWRQWIRHRTANVNEYSTRYSIAIDSAYETEPSMWRKQSQDNKQGSEGFLDERIGAELSKQEKEMHRIVREIYQKRVELGVAREQARKDLPLSTYTEAYWKIDLHNLLHFLKLRMDSHAQYEIRQYAQIIGNEIVSKWVPLTWEAFNDFQLNTTGFSALEMEILKNMLSDNPVAALALAENAGWLRKKDGKLVKSLERIEFEQKLEKLNLQVPWEE